MMANMKFHYKSLEELREECRAENVNIEFSEDTEVLGESLEIAGRRVPNRLAIQPMEGYDSDDRGAPGELTFRRYKRYAAGGAGLIWFEAVAVVEEGRSNAHQLVLSEATGPAFAELLQVTKETARREFGEEHEPFCVIQITHSGRFSKPYGPRRPVIAVHDSVFDKVVNIDETYPVLTDGELEAIRDRFVGAAVLAHKAGFDAVDIKSCHRYLISELLGAKTRTGKYGGSYENRTRFLKETIEMVKKAVPGLIISVRLNASDEVLSESAWGIAENGDGVIHDLTEIKRLVRELQDQGVALIDITAGTPYYNAYVTRPFDQPVLNGREEPEHPLKGVERLFDLAAEVQKTIPGIPVIGSGYSWLRQFGGFAAAANVKSGRHALAGFGRQAFAYPDLAKDLLETGRLAPNKCCITCSKCSQLMIFGTRTGCVVRDASVYAPVYKEALERNR